MEFQKYLFSLSIMGLSIAKYCDSNNIMLVVEKDWTPVKEYSTIYFDSSEEYDAFIDAKVGNDQFYNTARAVSTLLKYMSNAE